MGCMEGMYGGTYVLLCSWGSEGLRRAWIWVLVAEGLVNVDLSSYYCFGFCFGL